MPIKYSPNNNMTRIAKAISWVIAWVSLTISNIASASDVEISPFITSGSKSETTKAVNEAEANLWFFVNNNQSMAAVNSDNAGSNNTSTEYLPNYAYKKPYDFQGNPFPDPPSHNDYGYPTPFRDYLGGKTTFEVDNDWGVGICGKAADKSNCRIWQTYYGTRIASIKSILSILITEEQERFEGTRVGFASQFSTVNVKPKKGGINDTPLPVLPLKTDADREKLLRWAYGLGQTSDDETWLGEVTKVVNKITTYAKNNTSANNPFLAKPGMAPDATSNPILACRRNHLLIFSDGEWGNEDFTSGHYGKVWKKSLEKPRTLPDGEQYTKMSPYQREINSDFPDDQRTLADLAFTAWARDLDGNTNNNKAPDANNSGGLAPLFLQVDGAVQEHAGSPYWHPYNDPATWQHINTHVIGFSLNAGGKKKKIAHINPPRKDSNGERHTSAEDPGIRSEYLASNWKWKLNVGDEIPSNEIHRDMAGAALAGRGRFFNATNAQNLKQAIVDILDLVNEEVSASDIPGVKASGGALANSQTGGNSFYATSYDADFAGDLVRKDLYDGDPDKKDSCFTTETLANFPAGASLYGKICDKANKWSATEKLAEKPYGERNIYTSKRESNAFVGQDFNFDNLTVEQKVRIKGSDFPTAFGSLGVSGDDAKFKALVNYLKGDAANEAQNKLRPRSENGKRKVLGAITRSSPLVSGIPQISQVHPDKQSASFINFAKRYLYEKDTSTTPPTYTTLCDPACGTAVTDHNNVDIVYVGANDGMLHAFRASNGEEIFAYMPDAVYANLSKLSTSDAYKVAFVDGNIGVVVVGDKNKGWKKQLTASMGGGAKGIFSLDITDPTAANVKAEDVVMWEFTDKDSQYMGNIIGQPATVQLNDGTWAVVVGNGYNSAKGKAALVVINAETGQLIQELELSNNGDGTPNGLAPAYFQVFPNETGTKQNGIDRAYAGDLQGNLWVFDFTDATASGGVTVVNNKPLFTAVNGAGIRQPITVAPLVRQHPTKYGNIVHFGTGALFNEKDLSSTIQNSIYAVWDDWVLKANGGLPTPRSESVKREHLNVVKFAQLNGEENNTVGGNQSTVGRTLSKVAGENKKIQWATKGSTFTDKKRGWYIDLPMGERAWQSPYYTFGANNSVAIGYDTANYSPVKVGTAPTPVAPVDECSVSENAESGAISWKMTFNMNDATQPVAPVGTIDANGDGHVSSDDLVQKGAEKVQLSGLQSNGVTFSDNSMSTFSPLPITKPSTVTDPDPTVSGDVCSFVTQTQENNQGGLASKQICRRSHAGTWKELK